MFGFIELWKNGGKSVRIKMLIMLLVVFGVTAGITIGVVSMVEKNKAPEASDDRQTSRIEYNIDNV